MDNQDFVLTAKFCCKHRPPQKKELSPVTLKNVSIKDVKLFQSLSHSVSVTHVSLVTNVPTPVLWKPWSLCCQKESLVLDPQLLGGSGSICFCHIPFWKMW